MELKMHPEISKWRDQKLIDQPLFENLRDKGQLQNLVARKLPNGDIELLAGYRRHLALKGLGKKPEDMDIKILENVSDTEAILIAFSENNTRADLNMIEEARVFNSLAKLKLTHAQIAKKTQVSETYVRDRLHLLELPKEIQKLMQLGKVPVSYASTIRKLAKLGDKWQIELAKRIASTQWDSIKTVEQAGEFVEKTLAAEKKREELVAKYGVCPQCGSASIQEAQWSYDTEKLQCLSCKHEWNRETKEPWKVFELRQDAEKLGLDMEITKNGKATVTPEEITEIVEKRTKVIAGVEKPDPAFRSTHALGEMLKPLLDGDNIQKLQVDGETVNITLIQATPLHFKAVRKTYQTGEKSRIQVTEGWRDDEKVAHRIEAVKKFEASLPQTPRTEG